VSATRHGGLRCAFSLGYRHCQELSRRCQKVPKKWPAPPAWPAIGNEAVVSAVTSGRRQTVADSRRRIFTGLSAPTPRHRGNVPRSSAARSSATTRIEKPASVSNVQRASPAVAMAIAPSVARSGAAMRASRRQASRQTGPTAMPATSHWRPTSSSSRRQPPCRQTVACLADLAAKASVGPALIVDPRGQEGRPRKQVQAAVTTGDGIGAFAFG